MPLRRYFAACIALLFLLAPEVLRAQLVPSYSDTTLNKPTVTLGRLKPGPVTLKELKKCREVIFWDAGGRQNTNIALSNMMIVIIRHIHTAKGDSTANEALMLSSASLTDLFAAHIQQLAPGDRMMFQNVGIHFKSGLQKDKTMILDGAEYEITAGKE